MSVDLLFELDTSGEPSRRSSRLFYNTIGSLEITDDENSSKPSQDRPAILKTKTKRYHQQDDKLKFIPGQLSEQLRKAMGLKRMDIPEHIYRMRHLGYPPGWLKKAEVKSEVITIFGANNDIVKSSENTDKINVKYDWEKLFEFPGFNSYKFYDNRFDYCYDKGFMPMQEDCLLDNFKQFLMRSQMLGKELTDITEIRSLNSVRNSATDFNLPVNPGKRKPMASSTPVKEDIKRVKIEQFEELSEGEVIDDEVDQSSSMDCSVPKHDFVTEDGTVLLVSTVQEKPSLDRFSEGINEHRLFENLPNAGGTYQKVRDVLKKVRI